MKKAIIFDNDGTIVDSEPLHLLARQSVLRRHHRELTKAEYIHHWMSRPVIVGVQHTFTDFSLEEQEKIAWEVQEEYHKIRDKRLSHVPGFKIFINALHLKFDFAVATVLAKANVENSLNLVLSPEERMFFKIIVSGEEVKRNKPAPDVWLIAAQHLGYLPEECIAVEDSVTGVVSAKAAKMTTLARASEWSEAGLLYEAGADVVFRDYETLAHLL